MSSKLKSPIIVALDFSSTGQALKLVDRLPADSCRLKIGKELFTRAGPELVRELVNRGFDVFLDLKFHDIPNTVAKACAAAADLGVWMMNVHASGGRKMLEAAHEALAKKGTDRPLLIAVTVLTSMGQEDLSEVGIDVTPQQQVQRLALLSRDCGLDGVVCSPLEVAGLKKEMGDDFLLITPGIRPTGSDSGDQKRIMTPLQAIQTGSHYLVIGRPIIQAVDPVAVLAEMNKELGA
ncbi:MAG TPA: orotidine-5'-phosphate decarboxylase [Gammaproteobacteria bacterium]|nr:orotidine-5'-phosphate decarboxylase [Gammaproteobacteria bacterium]